LLFRALRWPAFVACLMLASACHGGGGSLPPMQRQDAVSPDTSGQVPSATDGTVSADSAATIESTATAGVPKHVKTAALIYGYDGTPTSVPLPDIAPHLTWAQTAPRYAGELRSAGLKVDLYVLFWRNYKMSDPNIGYTDIKPGGAYQKAESTTCTGTVITDDLEPGGGYPTDPRHLTPGLNLAKAVIDNAVGGATYDALFSDDTASMYGLSARPCDWSDSTWVSATNTLDKYLYVSMWVNGLNTTNDATTRVPLVDPPDVLGAICEACYVTDYNGSDRAVTGYLWTNREQAEIDVIARGKTFWAYPRAAGSAGSEIAQRIYGYASFLLTYEPAHAIIQEAFSTPSGFKVFPETGLVPENPEKTSSTLGDYRWASGAYGRRFEHCYFRGVDKGECAVVINPTTATVPIDTNFAHRLVLEGYGVLDAHEVYFNGSKVTSLAPGHAAILFH
jgi:hypothetical protein